MNNLPADQRPVGREGSPSTDHTKKLSSGDGVTPVSTDPEKSADSNDAGMPKNGSVSIPGRMLEALRSFWKGLKLRRFFFKALTMIYALVIFGYAYNTMSAHRQVLSYMGLMLLMVVIYAEILVIRDHLWVIEGSMRESRRWRDIFFNQTSLRRQRIRKFLSTLFAMCIFSYMHFNAAPGHRSILSFMGIMLLMTVLYYEILTIRDEIFVIGQSLQPQSDEGAEKRRQHYDKFIEQTKVNPENPEQPAKDETPTQS